MSVFLSHRRERFILADNGIKQFGFSEAGHILFDSAGTGENYRSQETKLANAKATEDMNEAARIINSLDGSQKKSRMGIWSEFRGASTMFGGQRAVESMLDIADKSDVLVYDIEALGTPQHLRRDGSANFFSPTELAFQKGQMINGKLQLSTEASSALSLLVAPDKTTSNAIQQAINQLQNGGWRGMSQDMRRTLADLTAYSGSPDALFQKTKIGGNTFHTIVGHSEKVSANASLGMPEVISKIQQGFNNLKQYGTAESSAIDVLNTFITKKNTKLVGYNTTNYDEPALKEFFGRNTGLNTPTSKKANRLLDIVSNPGNIDIMHALRSVTANPSSRFGSSMTLSNVHEVFGFKRSGRAHHGLTDVKMTADIFEKVYGQVKNAHEITRKRNWSDNSTRLQRKLTAPFHWDNRSLNRGREVYAVSGMSSYKAGRFDGVYKQTEDGFKPLYDMKQNPIYARSMYKVEDFFDGIEMGGKKQYGVRLSSDEGNHHMLFRESKEELADALHQHFMPVSKNGLTPSEARALQNEDRGVRRYNKMFEMGDGGLTGHKLMSQMYTNLDETKGMSWKKAEEFLKAKYGNEAWMTDAYLRDFKTMMPRLQAEQGVWKPFLDEAAQLGDDKQKTIALSNYRSKILNEIGDNKTYMSSGGEPFIPVNVGDKVSTLRGWDKGAMTRNISSIVSDKENHVGPTSRSNMIKRFDELVNENLIPMFEGKKSMKRKIRGIQKDFHKNVMSGNSVYNIYEEVASMFQQHMNMNQVERGYERQAVSVVSPTYSKEVSAYSKDTSKVHSLVQEAITGSQYYGRNSQMLTRGALAQSFKQQQGFVNSIAERAGIMKNGRFALDNRTLNGVGNIQDRMTELVNTYTQKGFRVQVMDLGKRGLAVGLMDKDAPESLARKGYQGLLTDNRAAVFHLPSYSEDGSIKWKGQEYNNRFSLKSKNGKAVISTIFDEAVNGLIASAGRMQEDLRSSKELGKKDFFIQAERNLERNTRKVLERSPMNYNLGYSENGDTFEKGAARLNYNRSMYVDTSGLAEEWYRDKYHSMSHQQRSGSNFSRTADTILDSARAEHTSFIEQLNPSLRNQFQVEVNQWAENRFGLNFSSHGVNDRHMNQGYRVFREGDPRYQSAFGAYDPTSGENRQKALNYRPLEENTVNSTLSRMGEDGAVAKLRTSYGTTTRAGKNARGNDIDGISMRAAYMTDDQVMDSLQKNKIQIRSELDNLLGKGQISTVEHKRYLEMIDAGRASTYEGMAMMAKELQSAFNYTADVRIRLGDEYVMDGNLQAALDEHAKKFGGSFDPTKSIRFSEMDGGHDMSIQQTRALMDKDGMLTVGRLMTNETVREGYDKSNKRIKIKGWDAETRTLLLSQEQLMTEGGKTVSTTGRRHTQTFLPKSVLEIISGQEGVETIVSEFSVSKRMHGAYLEEKVRGYEDELLRQIHGASKASPVVSEYMAKNGITVGSLAKNGESVESKALNDLLLPKLRSEFGLGSDDIWTSNGRIVVDEQLGFTKQHAQVGLDKVASLDNQVGEMLGYNFRKNGIEYGQIVQQRHDVWADQSAVGQGKGRVRVGLKELRVMQERFGESGSQYMGLLMRELTGAGHDSGMRDVGSYVLNSMRNGFTPKDGDVVFDTTAMRPEIERKEVNGKMVDINAKLGKDGILRINPEAAMNMPEVTVKNMKFLGDDYAQTLIDSNHIEAKFQDEVTGEYRKTKVENFTTGKSEVRTSAYLALPDDTFGRSHVPLIDFNNVERNLGDTMHLNQLESAQRSLVKNIMEYNTLGASGTASSEEVIKRMDKLHMNITTGMDDYFEKINTFVSSGRDGSLINSTYNTRLGMSGHFRAQSVNPYAMYSMEDGQWKNTGKVKENVAYINKVDLLTMIDGKEDNILKAWGGEHPKFKSQRFKQDYILENMNEKGIYGSTVRYPVIDSSTIQTMKFETADWVRAKNIVTGIGSTARIAGDYDGDFFGAFLTGYKDKDNAKAIHNELKSQFGKEQISSQFRGALEMEDISSNILGHFKQQGMSEENARAQIQKMQIQGQYTVQDLQRDGLDAETMNELIRPKTTMLDDIETSIARSGKAHIGQIDNLRQKISILHDATQETLLEAGQITREQFDRSRAIMDEVTRRLSQDSISSKKFTVQNLTKGELEGMTNEQKEIRARQLANKRNVLLDALKEGLQADHVQVPTVMGHLRELGMIKEGREVSLEVGIGRSRVIEKMDDETLFRQGLEQVRHTTIMNREVGALKSISLPVGASHGTQKVHEMWEKGSDFVPTPASRVLNSLNNEEGQEWYEKRTAEYKSNVLRNFETLKDSGEFMDAVTSERTKLTSEAEVIDGGVMKMASQGKFREVMGRDVADGLRVGRANNSAGVYGAATFAAMWALSAVTRGGPTPEGLREQTQQGPAAPVDRLLTSPTARVTSGGGGEAINIRIDGNKGNMSHQDIAALVNTELQSMSGVQFNMNMNINDNSQNIDQKWLQDVVTNAVTKGYAH